jgi:hypothetical protein
MCQRVQANIHILFQPNNVCKRQVLAAKQSGIFHANILFWPILKGKGYSFFIFFIKKWLNTPPPHVLPFTFF